MNGKQAKKIKRLVRELTVPAQQAKTEKTMKAAFSGLTHKQKKSSVIFAKT